MLAEAVWLLEEEAVVVLLVVEMVEIVWSLGSLVEELLNARVQQP